MLFSLADVVLWGVALVANSTVLQTNASTRLVGSVF